MFKAKLGSIAGILVSIAMISCGDSSTPTPPVVVVPPPAGPFAPGPGGSSLNIGSLADESGDAIIITGEAFTLHGDGTSNFTLASTITLDGQAIAPTSVSAASISFKMPRDRRLGSLVLSLKNDSTGEIDSILIDHRKVVLIPANAQALGEVYVYLLNAAGTLSDTNARLLSGSYPDDIALSPDGGAAYVSANSVITSHRLTNIDLTNAAPVSVPATSVLNVNPTFPGAGQLNLSGIDISSDGSRIVAIIESDSSLGSPLANHLVVISISATHQLSFTNYLPTATLVASRDLRIGLANTLVITADAVINRLISVELFGSFFTDWFSVSSSSSSVTDSFDEVETIPSTTLAVASKRLGERLSFVDLSTQSESAIRDVPTDFGAGVLSSNVTRATPDGKFLFVPNTDTNVVPFTSVLNVYDTNNADSNVLTWTPMADDMFTSSLSTLPQGLELTANGSIGILMLNLTTSPSTLDRSFKVFSVATMTDGNGSNDVFTDFAYVPLVGSKFFKVQP